MSVPSGTIFETVSTRLNKIIEITDIDTSTGANKGVVTEVEARKQEWGVSEDTEIVGEVTTIRISGETGLIMERRFSRLLNLKSGLEKELIFCFWFQ